jgi:outer membrane protein OmpA-like peptidoglycan-associated protein
LTGTEAELGRLKRDIAEAEARCRRLSSERALCVVDLLLKFGMSPTSLSAAGYAEFDPLSSTTLPSRTGHPRGT